MLENFYGRRYSRRLKKLKAKINNSTTDAESFCYLGRYPDIAKSVGRYNLYGGKDHWYRKGRHKNLDKSCPYLISKDDFEKRQEKHDSKKKENKDIISQRKDVEKDYRDKNTQIKDIKNSIDELNYKIYDKQYTVPEFDISKLFLENEGFSNYIIEGVTGMNEYTGTLTEQIHVAAQAIASQEQQSSNIEKNIAFLEEVNEDAKNTTLIINDIKNVSNDETVNKTREIEKQNSDIDKIIIKNTKNDANTNYVKGFYLQDDSIRMKRFNQYYLFWIYFILFIAISFIFISKINQDNKVNTYIFVFILAIYPFIIGMIQSFGYNILYKIYNYFNFNIYNKT